MFWYLAVIAFLTILACYEHLNGEKSKPVFYIATITMILFIGTRYETGFDWVEYEKFYTYVSPIGDTSGIYVPPEVAMEPGFQLILSILKSFGLSFQAVIFIISTFSIGVVAWVANRYSPRPVLVLVWYFGFSALPAQMAAIRQGLSFSVVLISLLLMQDSKKFGAVLTAAIACTVHVFSVAVAPLIFLKSWQPRTIYVLLFAMVGTAASFSSIDVLDVVATGALGLLGAGNLLADKLNIYNGGAGTTVSPTGLLLTVWDILFLYLVEKRRSAITDQDRIIVNFAVKCALFSVFAHSFLATFPAIWNRVSYISMLMEMIVLTRLYDGVIVDAVKRQMTILSLSATSAAVLLYGLSAPSALPYLPYQSQLAVWATGDQGDGRLRYTYAMQQAEREMKLSKD